MGKAVIVSAVGDGLYRARPIYDTRVIDKELERLNTEAGTASLTLIRALNTLSLLEDETEVARRAMNEVIRQWQQDLLNTGTPPPIEPPTEDDPETGLPWDPPDSAQYGPLTDAINAARTEAGKSTLTRDDDLDFAARRHAWDMSGSRLMGHVGSDKSVPSSRVAYTGYQADFVVELVACGSLTAERAVHNWSINASSSIYSDTATQLGVAYTYSTHHPATHLWVAVLAHPDPDPDPSPPTVTYPDDPAQKTAREQESGMEKIEPPKTTTDQPEKLGEVVRKFGIAAGKQAAAEKEVARLTIEGLVRGRRIDALTAFLANISKRVWDVWSATYTTNLQVGQEVNTVEPPGWLDYTPTAMQVSTGGPTPYDVVVNERRWNLVPSITTSQGKLSSYDNMSPESVFYAAALEPGWARWKPISRYGIITAISENWADVQLESADIRLLSNEEPTQALVLDPTDTLSAVPIYYPPCHGRAFHADDEVLVMFEGQDRTKPKIIGFRRAPRWCAAIGWSEL